METDEYTVVLPDLYEFMNNMPEPNSAYISEAGFNSLYIRKTKKWYGDIADSKVGKFLSSIVIANAVATIPGNGAFTELLRKLKEMFPHRAIYAENVHNERLEKKLIRLGFQRDRIPFCYYLLPDDDLNV